MGALIRVLLLVGLLVTYWWAVLLVLAAVGFGAAVWLGHQRQLEAAGRRRREQAALVARADQHHAWVLAGDDRGVHGVYRPQVMSWVGVAVFMIGAVAAGVSVSAPAQADPVCAKFDTCQYLPNPYNPGPLMPVWEVPGPVRAAR